MTEYLKVPHLILSGCKQDHSRLEARTQDAVKECVRYIICREGSKIPIKRIEIIKHLQNTYQTSTNHINTVILEADKLLKKIYGIKLVQVESKSGIQYIAVLEEPCEKSLLSLATDASQRKILSAMLTHIFMSGAPVKEDDMWSFLSEADLIQENDYAGRKILTHIFTKQMYLKYTKVGEGDLSKYTFEWGQRAIEEVPRMFLLKKFAE
ncbi:unnamed protein product [Leptidea sinapis]|uniref:MAGE domain-containing protein n=1 Tax=Leptidea sinapis TaxID=189913 RepID=A0A5E4PUD8_9NEOP|nr:unnamed protein product [Leptidea sinapis]